MIELLENYGFTGLFAGSFLAATIVPFSSDVLIIGVLVAGMNPLFAFLWATAGNWLGGLTSYWIGHFGKWQWIEKWMGISEEKLLKQKHWIDKHGALIAFFSWMPFVGDVLSLGLGFYKVNFTKSAIFMLIGKAVRYAFWVLLYFLLGDALIDFKIL
ncbi:MAG: YqaA family protein [Bacteroidales bacterium]